MTSQHGNKQFQYLYTSSMLNISRSKGNQRMKFGHLIEHNMRNIFLEKSCTKYGRGTIPRLFTETSKLNICLDQQSKVLHDLFYSISGLGLSKYNETKPQSTCFYLPSKAFLKNQKKVWNQSPCLIFCMIFEEKYFSCYILLTDQTSLSGCLYFVRWIVWVLQLFVKQVVKSQIWN